MERMWRKVNHSFGAGSSNSRSKQSSSAGGQSGTANHHHSAATTLDSAGGFGDGQIVVAVANSQAAAAAASGTQSSNANNTTSNNNPQLPSSTATGRRLAASGGGIVAGASTPTSAAAPPLLGSGAAAAPTTASGGATLMPTAGGHHYQKSLSQHVLQTRTASSERRRRRRRKSRPRRSGVVVSCVGGGGGDNMSSSGGFYTIKDAGSGAGDDKLNQRQRRHRRPSGSGGMLASSAPTGTVMMYPNPSTGPVPSEAATSTATVAEATASTAASAAGATAAAPDISLRQRAVAKLRMFNFHLNWDLHMTHCKPCGPRLGSGSGGGNIITRRLCRNRRREENELYRSNSFKFERFERKECLEELSDTLQKQIAICDDYSLPVDFVKKRPSSFDPCLADSIPTNPENWIQPSPQAEFLQFAEQQQQTTQGTLQGAAAATTATAHQQQPPQLHQQQQQQQAASQPPPPPAPLSTLPSGGLKFPGVAATSTLGGPPLLPPPNNTLPSQPSASQHNSQQSQSQQHHTQKTTFQQQQQQPPQLPAHKAHTQQRAAAAGHQQRPIIANSSSSTIKQANVKLIEGYSDPKDTKRHKKVYHKKGKKRGHHKKHDDSAQSHSQTQPHHHHQHLQQHQQPHHQHHQQHHHHFHQHFHQQLQQLQSEQQAQLLLHQQQQQLQQQQLHQASLPPPKREDKQQQPQKAPHYPPKGLSNNNNSSAKSPGSRDKRSNYSSDSSAPKSSDEEDNDDEDDENSPLKVPELNSPDSISDDLVRPLPPDLYRSPRKLTVSQSETSKRNPSPYYYSDILKAKSAAPNATDKETKIKSRQSTASEPPQLTQPPIQVGPYRKSTSLDVPERDAEPLHEHNDEAQHEASEFHADDDEDFEETEPTHTEPTVFPKQANNGADYPTPKRYSFTEDGVRIIRCDSPSTTTSDESDCSECEKRRQWHAKALALVRKTCNVQPLLPAECSIPASGYLVTGEEADQLNDCAATAATAAVGTSMPPHRFGLGPAAVCACVAPATIGDDIDEYFRPRSIFYVHPHGVHECDDCCSKEQLNDDVEADQENQERNGTGTATDSDDMTGRTRQIYETAFDCKIAKSDDDLDEVDRITNHSVLLQLNNGNNLPSKGLAGGGSASAKSKSRLEGKRLKNSKNQALQEQQSTGNGAAAPGGSGSPHTTASGSLVDPAALANELNILHIQAEVNTLGGVDQQNNPTTATNAGGPSSTSQLPMRGYTPSPPSTAPLPMKFPGKHERFFMNSIRSAPNLPAANPSHPRLRDLRLPLQSSMRSGGGGGAGGGGSSSLATSNEDGSAFVNPPSSHHNLNLHHHHQHHHQRHSQQLQSVEGLASSRTRSDRPRSFVLESGRVLELRKGGHHGHHQQHHHHHGGDGGGGRKHNYSSTESIATSSSGGSMESLRSSTSEGNRSTSSSESRHSTSLSSHSSESAGSCSVAGGGGGGGGGSYPLRAPVLIHSKLHILSPISDKSSQEQTSDVSGDQLGGKQQRTPDSAAAATTDTNKQQGQAQQLAPPNGPEGRSQMQLEALRKRRPPNKTLMHLADEMLGSDSGISLHSREEGAKSALQKFTLPKLNFPPSDKGAASDAATTMSGSVGLPQDLRDLPFDMPKLRRRKTLQQDACTSGSATSVDLGDLPFDMPKLRRRLRANQVEINNLMVHSTESSGISQASSSHSMRGDELNPKAALKLDTAIFRQNLTLNLNETRQANNKFGSLDLRGLSTNKELNLNLTHTHQSAVDLIDVSIPLERQGWYHGAITRVEAETTLRPLTEGSFLVRNCESTKQDYSLSLKGAKGFMHMRIQRNESGQYILGQFSRPFETVPDMIRHFCLNRLPVRGAEHMCLIEPVIAQLL